MKQQIKKFLFRLLGKEPEAVIVYFRSSDEALSDAMREEIRRLEPERRIFEARADESYWILRRKFRKYRIGLAPAMLPLRFSILLLAPTKILAYNTRLERHHLKLTSLVASWLFLCGVPLDRIYLRPRWLWPLRKDKTIRPAAHQITDGRPRSASRKSVAVLTPYFPHPLSHGGAVRMFNLLRETAREFDVILYAFTEGQVGYSNLAPVLKFCSRAYLVQKPRYREPRWSTFAPPEVGEYDSPAMLALWNARETDLAQIEYTQLASHGGDILVEHDVTFDLYAQICARRKTLIAWWDWWRWQRFERRAIAQSRRVVVMSEKDLALIHAPQARIVENGVDLARFEPQPEQAGRNVLFIGSFRHFPNIVAFRFLTEEILPLAPPELNLTVVAGPEPWLHWKNHTGTLRPPENPHVRVLEFVADVRPLYHETNLVVVPTLESAGTNVKVLEAMAMERAVVSTTTGCQGFGLEHGKSVWIADSPKDFAAGIGQLLDDNSLRSKIARAGRAHVEKQFDWRAIGLRQRELYYELLGNAIEIRCATRDHLSGIEAIQRASFSASQWPVESYLEQNCLVAINGNAVAGFLVSRQTAPGEQEILNVAIDPSQRRRGIARRLIEHAMANTRATWFLEVRESNTAAIALYKSLGFEAFGRREKYYREPEEAAIVMRGIS